MKCFVVLSALLCVVAAAAKANPDALFYSPASFTPTHYGLLGGGYHVTAAGPLLAPSAAYTTPALSHPTAAIAPYTASVPAVASSQYHTQDELSNYEYGYSNVNSAKQERGNARAGVVEGSYSYVDGSGLPQKVSYVADALGFRAYGTNVPTNGAHLGAIGGGVYSAPYLGRGLLRYRRDASAEAAAEATAEAEADPAYLTIITTQHVPSYAHPHSPLTYVHPHHAAAAPIVSYSVHATHPAHPVTYAHHPYHHPYAPVAPAYTHHYSAPAYTHRVPASVSYHHSPSPVRHSTTTYHADPYSHSTSSYSSDLSRTNYSPRHAYRQY